jgi:hypothetical protein
VEEKSMIAKPRPLSTLVPASPRQQPPQQMTLKVVSTSSPPNPLPAPQQPPLPHQCTHCFFQKHCDKPLANSTSKIHGGDRYCIEHIVFYNETLREEILCNCATINCPLKVCRKRRADVRTAGDNRFCNSCLQKPEVQRIVTQEINFVPSAYNAEDEYWSDSDDEEEEEVGGKEDDRGIALPPLLPSLSPTSPSLLQTKPSSVLTPSSFPLPQIKHNEKEPSEESKSPSATSTSFLHQTKYTRDHINTVALEAHGANFAKHLISTELVGFVSAHVRCMVEVLLLRLPQQTARVLAWIALETSGTPKERDWRSAALVMTADEIKLRGALFLHKKWVITELMGHIERVYQRANKALPRKVEEILAQLREERQADVTQATFDLFVTELREQHRQVKSPLTQFVEQCIRINNNDNNKPLTTTQLFDAYNKWAQEHGKPLVANSSAFGKLLVKENLLTWKTDDKSSNKTRHYGISIKK